MPNTAIGSRLDALNYIKENKLGSVFNESNTCVFDSIQFNTDKGRVTLQIYPYPNDFLGLNYRKKVSVERYIDEMFEIFEGYDMISWHDKNESLDIIKIHLNGNLFLIRLTSDGNSVNSEVSLVQEKIKKRNFPCLENTVGFLLRQSGVALAKTPEYKSDKHGGSFTWTCDITCVADYKEHWGIEYGNSFKEAFEKAIQRDDCKIVAEQLGMTVKETKHVKVYAVNNRVDEEKYKEELQENAITSMLSQAFPPKVCTVYRAQGTTYEKFGEYITNVFYTVWGVVPFNNYSVFEEVPYKKGDVIGRGYGKVKVLKSFTAYIVYYLNTKKSFSKEDGYIFIPEFGFTVIRLFGHDCPCDIEGESERDYIGRNIMWHFHCKENKRFNSPSDENIADYLKCEKRVEDRLINIDGDDLVKDTNLYSTILYHIKEMFYNVSLFSKRKSVPNGLAEFVGGLKMGEFIEYAKMTADRYTEDEAHYLNKDDKANFKPFKGYLLKQFHEFGDSRNYESFASVFDALDKAGFKPAPDKNAKKRVKASDKYIVDKEKKQKDGILSNISRLGTDILHEIAYQWWADHGTLGFGEVNVNGKTYRFTKDMAIREEDNYEQYYGMFTKALEKHGFSHYVGLNQGDDDTTFALNVSKLVPKDFRHLQYFSEHEMLCYVTIRKDDLVEGMRELFVRTMPLPDDRDCDYKTKYGCHAYFKGNQKGGKKAKCANGTFLEAIRKIVDENGGCLKKTANKVYADDKYTINTDSILNVIIHVAKQQFVLAMKDFLAEAEKNTPSA